MEWYAIVSIVALVFVTVAFILSVWNRVEFSQDDGGDGVVEVQPALLHSNAQLSPNESTIGVTPSRMGQPRVAMVYPTGNNSQPALVKAIADLKANGGGVLRLAAGVYILDGTDTVQYKDTTTKSYTCPDLPFYQASWANPSYLTIDFSNVMVIGYGAVITRRNSPDPGNAALNIVAPGIIENIHVHGLTFDWMDRTNDRIVNEPTQFDGIMFFQQIADATFRDITVYGRDYLIEDNVVKRASGSAFAGGRSHSITFDNCRIYGKGTPMDLGQLENLMVRNCVFSFYNYKLGMPVYGRDMLTITAGYNPGSLPNYFQPPFVTGFYGIHLEYDPNTFHNGGFPGGEAEAPGVYPSVPTKVGQETRTPGNNEIPINLYDSYIGAHHVLNSNVFVGYDIGVQYDNGNSGLVDGNVFRSCHKAVDSVLYSGSDNNSPLGDQITILNSAGVPFTACLGDVKVGTSDKALDPSFSNRVMVDSNAEY